MKLAKTAIFGWMSLVMQCGLSAQSHAQNCSGVSSAEFRDGFEGSTPGANVSLWSDPATWGGAVPGPNSDVVIPTGRVVLLDVNADIATLSVDGELHFAPKDLELRSRWVMVHGTLAIGSATTAFPCSAKITLYGENTAENVMGMGTKFVGSMGAARIDLHGKSKTAWTLLGAHANVGASQITLSAPAADWNIGDRIVIGPTDYDALQAEERIITAINGAQISFDQPLSHLHWGSVQTLSGANVDTRGVVANLSRNIMITSELANGSSFGGHTMFHAGSSVRIANVEFARLGQLGRLGRYPVHFHVMRNQGAGSYVRNSVIRNTLQRGMVIHQSNDLDIRNNVIYDTVGMQYFLEDGIEIRNHFEGNLGMLVRPVPNEFRLSQADGDNRPERPAVFWITNAHNTLINNRAVGVVRGWGFAMEGSDKRPQDMNPPIPAGDTSRNLPGLTFSGNVAQTIGAFASFNLGYGPEESGSCFRFCGVNDQPAEAITNTTAFKCKNAAIWSDCGRLFDGINIADARAAVTQDQGLGREVRLRNAVIVGISGNNPQSLTDLTVGPFTGPGLYEDLQAGATLFSGTQIVGNFLGVNSIENQGAVSSPAINAPNGVANGNFRIIPNDTTTVLARGNSTASVNVMIERLGYTGPVELRMGALPEQMTAPSVTIPANSNSATLTLNAGNLSLAHTDRLQLVARGGSRTKLETLGYLHTAPVPIGSASGTNVAVNAYAIDSGRYQNRGSGLAVDGNLATYAELIPADSGGTAWMQVDLDRPKLLNSIRITPNSSAGSLADFVVLTSDFPLFTRSMSLQEALQLPQVSVFSFNGAITAPITIPLPAGHSARVVRVWKRGVGDLRIHELEAIAP
jgi:hypothetical protein